MSPLHKYNADVGDDDVFMVSVHLVTLLGCGCLPACDCSLECTYMYNGHALSHGSRSTADLQGVSKHQPLLEKFSSQSVQTVRKRERICLSNCFDYFLISKQRVNNCSMT
jgi:hypothetical protein